jgi:hypothetical protein
MFNADTILSCAGRNCNTDMGQIARNFSHEADEIEICLSTPIHYSLSRENLCEIVTMRIYPQREREISANGENY